MYPFKSHRVAAPGDEDTPQMPTVAEKNIRVVVRLEHEALNQRSFADQVGDTIASAATKPWFIAAHLLVFGTWVSANAIGWWRFDPPPFDLLSTVIAIEAIFLTLTVLASQHRMARISNRRAHLNLQIDLLAEREMTVMIRMLEKLLEHSNVDPDAVVPDAAELRKTTDFAALVDQLESRLNGPDGPAHRK